MEITTITKIGKTETMTSLEIAEVTGKQHAHVMRDIRVLIDKINESTSGLVDCREDYHRGDRTQYKYLSDKTQAAILDWCFGKQNTSSYIIESSTYKDTKGEERNMYVLNKKACLLLASGYDVILRAKIINRWEELEMKARENALPNFSNPAEAARAWADQYEKNLALEAKNKEMKPKAEYFDALVDRNMLTNFTDTAKQLGLKRKDFIERLIRDGYLYRDNKNALKPYAQYADTLFVIRDGKNENNNWAGQQTLITPKGKETFRLLYHL